MSHPTTLYSDIKDFVYITLKLQAKMHDSDESFYGVKSTRNRITSYILTYLADHKPENIGHAKEAMIAGFERLKDEEDIPILCYDTIEQLSASFEDRLRERNVS